MKKPDITIYRLNNGKIRVWFLGEQKKPKTAYVVGQSLQFVQQFVTKQFAGKNIKIVDRHAQI